MGGRGGSGERNDFSNPKEFTSGKDSDKYFNKNSYSNEEDLRLYTDYGMRINSALREGDIFLKDTVDNVTSAIKNEDLKDDIYVYRAGSNELLGFKEGESITMEKLKKNNLIGAVLKDKGFVSTTTTKDALITALGYKLGDDEPIYRIKVKAGKGKGIYVNPISHFKDQYEYLLQRNSKFKVIGAHKDKKTNRTIVDLEV